ncbi:MAG: hypothetical protein IPJ71_13305 [Bdellovibrionales bacterium]|nr:hypothetical protein [Bdellovibrionales bacterium]
MFLLYSSVRLLSATEMDKCRNLIQIKKEKATSVLSGFSGHSSYLLTIRQSKANESIPFEVIGHLGGYAEMYLVEGSSSQSLLFSLKPRGVKDRGNLVRNVLSKAVERLAQTETKFQNLLKVRDLSSTDIGLSGIFNLTEGEFISFFNVLIEELQRIFPILEVEFMESEDSIISKRIQSVQAAVDHNYQALHPRNASVEIPAYKAIYSEKYRRMWDDGTTERVSEVMTLNGHQIYVLRVSRWPGENRAYAETIAFVDAHEDSYWNSGSKMWINQSGQPQPEIWKVPSKGGNRFEIFENPLDGETLKISWIKIDFKWEQLIFRDVWRLSVVKADGSSVHQYFAPAIGLIREEQYSSKGKLVRQKQLIGTE